MANQTLTNAILNYDDATIGGLANGETITINNSTLIINSDVRWNQQAAVIGAMTISSTLGGNINIIAEDTWEIPFGIYNNYYPEMVFLLSSNVYDTGNAGSKEYILIGYGDLPKNRNYYAVGDCSYFISDYREGKFYASNAAENDAYGYSVNITPDKSRTIVGALSKNVSTFSNTGAAYIYFSDEEGINEEQFIECPDPENNAMFGYTVAITSDGSRVIISAVNKTVDSISECGCVYVFSRSGVTWSQEQVLSASDKVSGDSYGTSIDISLDGTRVAIGAYTRSSGGVVASGAVYIYSRSGTVWTQEQILIASDKAASDQLGYSVSINSDGTRVAIGAYGRDSGAISNSGAVYIYSRSGTVWTQEQILIASDKAASDQLGYSVKISSDSTRVLIGAYNRDSGAISNSGAVYVFSRSGTVWTQEQILIASDKAINDLFGSSVNANTNCDIITIGSPGNSSNGFTTAGAIYTFTRSGTVWTESYKIIESNQNNTNGIGKVIAMDGSGNFILTGNVVNDGQYGTITNSGVLLKYENITVNGFAIDIRPDITLGDKTVFNFASDFTISFNVANMFTGYETILLSLCTNATKYAAVQIYINASGYLCYRLSSNGTSWGFTYVSTQLLSIQNIYTKLPNIFLSKTGTTYRLFYNGVNLASSTYATALMQETGSDNYKHYIGGKGIFCINELAIFNGISYKTDTVTFTPRTMPWGYNDLDTRYLGFTNTSTGNTPANNAIGSNTVTGVTSGATGELLRVFTESDIFSPALPVNYSTALPKGGFIKLRYKTGTFIEGETINLPGGGTIKALNAGKRSWIHIVGRESTTITVPRLGSFYTSGDNYYLGETNGLNNQAFQYPIIDICPALEIETSPGSNIYETYLNAGSRWGLSDTNIPFIATDARGMYFYTNAANGVIEIARRGYIYLGYQPVAGCKVRIPNILCSNAISTAYSFNRNDDVLATRYDFNVSSSGLLDINNVSMNWYLGLASPYEVKLKNSNFLESILVNNCSGLISIENIGIGINKITLVFNPFQLANNIGQTIVDKVFAARGFSGAASLSTCLINDSQNLTLNNIRCDIFGLAAKIYRNAANNYAISITRCIDYVANNLQAIGGPLSLSNNINGIHNNIEYSDILTTYTDLNFQVYAIYITNCVNTYIDGFKNFKDILNIHPYLGIINATSTSKYITFKNMGTKESPYNYGTINPCRRLTIMTACFDVLLKDIYTINSGISATNSIHSINNSNAGITLENVHCEYNKTQSIIGNNLISRSCSYTAITTGQSAIYGSTLHDFFISDTLGNIIFMCNEPLVSTADQAVISYTDLGFIPDLFVNIPAAMVGNVTLSNSNRRILFNNYVNASGLDLPYTDFITSYNDFFVNNGSNEQLKNYVEFEIINTNAGGLVLGILVNRTINETLVFYSSGRIRYYNSLNGSSITIIANNIAWAVTQGDIIGLTIDRVLNEVKFYKNNVLFFNSSDYIATTLSNFTCQYAKIAVGTQDSSLPSVEEVEVNFGQKPFAYTAPSGFYGKYGHTAFSKYTAAGSLLMNYPGNEIIFEMPYFAIGHTGLTNTLPLLNCYNSNVSFYNIEFQYDTGFGYNGTWLNLKSTSLSTIINTIDPTSGFKLKVKIYNINTAVTSDYITSLTIETQTDIVSKFTNVPPAIVLIKAGITNLISGSRVYVYNSTKDTVVYNDIVNNTFWELYYENDDLFSVGDIVNLIVTYFDGVTSKLSYKNSLLATSSGWTALCDQEDDLIYEQNNINGSTVTGLAVTIPYVIDINRPSGNLTVQALYAWTCYYKNTVDGISIMTKSFTAIDNLNYRINAGSNWSLKNMLSDTPLFIDGGYLFTENNTVPIISSSYTIWFNSGRAYSAPVNATGLALEATSQAILAATNDLALESTVQSVLTATGDLSLETTSQSILTNISDLALESTSQNILKTSRTIVGLTA